jgi:hypothetical protein
VVVLFLGENFEQNAPFPPSGRLWPVGFERLDKSSLFYSLPRTAALGCRSVAILIFQAGWRILDIYASPMMSPVSVDQATMRAI